MRDRRAAPPLLAWAAAALLLVVVAAVLGEPVLAARTWARWDSGLYFDIARHGYTLFPCPTQPGDWCGNSAWFPLYPWLLAALHAVGLPIPGTGVVLAWVCMAAALVVVWRYLLDGRLNVATGAAIAYAAFVPGQIFDFAAYPLSLLALTTAAHLALLLRGRWVGAGICGFLAALSYPLGVLLAVSSGLWLLLDGRPALRERLRRIALVAGPTAAGGLLVVVVQRIQTGSWHAFFRVQSRYEHGFHLPINTLRADLYAVRSASPLLQWQTARPLQSLFVAFVLACVVVALIARRRLPTRPDLLLLLFAILTWAVPQAETGVSRYRSQAALLPLAALLPRLPRPVVVVLAAAAALLAIPMAWLFFHGRLM